MLRDLPGGAVGFLIFVNIFVFFLAFFLDFFEIAFIVVPLLAPVARRARHRPDLVRRAALREHADLVHAPALRLRAVLPARHRAEGGEDQRHLLGRDPLDRRCSWSWSAIVIFWPEIGDLLDRRAADARPGRRSSRALEGMPMPDAGSDLGPPELRARPELTCCDSGSNMEDISMKRRNFLKVAAGGGAAAARWPPRRSPRASRSCSWRLTSGFPRSLDTHLRRRRGLRRARQAR